MVDSRYQIYHPIVGHLEWATTKDEAFRIAHRISMDERANLPIIYVVDCMAHRRRVNSWEVWGLIGEPRPFVWELTCRL